MWDVIEIETFERVRALGVPFETLTCAPEEADTAVFCARFGWPLETAANTLLVATRRDPKRYAACVVLGTSRVANAALRRLLESSRVSFATEDEMRALTGMTAGGVTVFGLPADVPIYVDARVMEQPFVILGSGGRHGKIKIGPDVFQRLPSAVIVDGLARSVDEPAG